MDLIVREPIEWLIGCTVFKWKLSEMMNTVEFIDTFRFQSEDALAVKKFYFGRIPFKK